MKHACTHHSPRHHHDCRAAFPADALRHGLRKGLRLRVTRVQVLLRLG